MDEIGDKRELIPFFHTIFSFFVRGFTFVLEYHSLRFQFLSKPSNPVYVHSFPDTLGDVACWITLQGFERERERKKTA